MSPLCPYFVPSFTFRPTGILFDRDRENFLKMLGVAKLLATNAKLAANAFLQGKHSHFDPIVHENSCQIRAFAVILLSRSPAMMEEAQRLKEAAMAVEKALIPLQNKPPIPDQEVEFEAVLAKFNLSLDASPEMTYLLQTHFLTVGKVFIMKQDGSETAYIDYQTLKHRVSKQADTDFLKRIVDFTQVKLAEASVRFIQAEASCVGGHIEQQLMPDQIKMVLPPDKDALPRPCSCAFYNFKTILLRAREERVVIVIKKYLIGQDKPCSIFYRGSDTASLFAPLTDKEMAALNPKDPVFVIEGFMPPDMDRESLHKHIEKISLLDIALINVARVSQFSSQDFDPEKIDARAREEIESYRKRAEELGCSLQKPRAFSIVHTHAGTVQEEIERLS